MEGGRDGVVLSEGRMGCKAGVAWFEMQERRGEEAGWSVVTLGVGGGRRDGSRGQGILALSSTSQSWLSPGATRTDTHPAHQRTRRLSERERRRVFHCLTSLRTLTTLNNVQNENCQD